MKLEQFFLILKILFAIQTLLKNNFCLSLSRTKNKINALPKSMRKATPVQARRSINDNNDTNLQQTIFKANNNSLEQIVEKDLNEQFVTKDLPNFEVENKDWVDNKLFNFHMEDIFQDFTLGQQTTLTPSGLRAAYKIFLQDFRQCDLNFDNLLSFNEFLLCMKTSKYFVDIIPTMPRYATYSNYSYTNSTGFYPLLYKVIKNFHFKYINFADYMILRLMAFSWKKCSVVGPFIEEVAFECAIQIATGWRSISRNTSRKLYYFALELSNGRNVRNIDFITFVNFAYSTRLFGKINGREDHDATKSEFNLALDKGGVPERYNQDIINQMYRLIEQRGKPNQGMDLISFIFYDLGLKFFVLPEFKRRWYMDLNEFSGTFSNFLFPYGILQEIESIPQNHFSEQSYQMFTYLNISQYNQEGDYFLKFSQKNEKKKINSKLKSKSKNLMKGYVLEGNGNMTFNLSNTVMWIFSIIDNDYDGWINFYDFGNFLQIAYLYNKFDIQSKGRIVCGTLFEKFNEYSDFPFVSYHVRERAQRFNLMPQDLYLDLLRTILILRMDDIVEPSVRRFDPSTLTEFELKNIFKIINLEYVPDAYLNKCLRGVNANNIPKYDWECAFLQAITITAQVLESYQFYQISKEKGLTLLNTVFKNVDPNIR